MSERIARSPECWRCGGPVAEERLEFEAVLVPRTASQGGPVIRWRCSSCKTDNVAERNRAGETLLIPPHLAGLRSSTVKGPVFYSAKKWAAENAALRAEFLSRTRPGIAAPTPDEDPDRPAEEPPPAIEPDDPDEDPSPRGPDPREIGTVLDAYQILDLPVTADTETIRRRYRELSRKCHPDRVADLDDEIRKVAERRFKEITRAYEALTGKE